MGLGSALSEEEGMVKPSSFFILDVKIESMVSKAKTFIALDASGELVILMLAVLVHVQLEALKLVGQEELLLVMEDGKESPGLPVIMTA